MQSVEVVGVEPSPDEGRSEPTGLSPAFWRFFVVCLGFDVGFGLYFFLINLYLADWHFGEKSIGLIAGALTLGNLAATIPTGVLARRLGLRPMLLFCFAVAPMVAMVRLFAMAPAAQILLAFVQGAAMCSYTVSFAPAITLFSTTRNRTTAFSIMFGTGIGSGVLGGVAGGFLPEWLHRVRPSVGLRGGMAGVLLLASVVALAGIVPLFRMTFPRQHRSAGPGLRSAWNPFVARFLGMIAVWNLAIGAVAPFASLYFSGPLHIALSRIGMVFSGSQLLQVTGILAAPALYRRIGQRSGIALLQASACVALVVLSTSGAVPIVIGAYLCLTTFQYMCNPAIYSMLMEQTREDLRPSASALQNFVCSSAIAIASAAGGVFIAQFRYAALFVVCATVSAVAAALTFRLGAVEPQPDASMLDDRCV